MLVTILWLVLVFVAVALTAAVVGHQLLLQRRLACQEALESLSEALKKRYGLIPNLCELAGEHAAHEKRVLEGVRAAREAAGQAEGIHEKNQAQRALARALRKLLDLADRYPGLRSSLEFQRVQRELASAESQILTAIDAYNQRVEKYHHLRRSPGLRHLASLLRIKPLEAFDRDITAVVKSLPGDSSRPASTG